ncbi:MAG TPA: hypothetical protein VGM75_22185 [Pseudonocardiaceae bacterium]
MPLSPKHAASALGWVGPVVPDVGILGHRVAAVVRLHPEVDRWRRSNGWPPQPDPSWFRTWFDPGPIDRTPLPAVSLVGVLVTESEADRALNSCGTLITLAKVAVILPGPAAEDPWPLNEFDYYGVGVVSGDDDSPKVVVPPEDRAVEFGPSLYGRWLQEVLYDRVVRGLHVSPSLID